MLIEKNGERVLFDTGWDSNILFTNASSIDLMGVEKIVVSHAHWDHMGSLPALLPFDSAKKVYFSSATENMRRENREESRPDNGGGAYRGGKWDIYDRAHG